jgi:AAA domain/DnaB-like helicase N terminal domain
MAMNAHDMMSEQGLLGAMLTSPDSVSSAFLAVPVEAYYFMQHSTLASIMRDMFAKRQPIDPITVLAEVEDRGLLSRIPGNTILDIHGRNMTVGNADHYASWINELYGRRRLADEFDRELQRLDADWNSGDPTPMADVIGRVRATLDELVHYATSSVDMVTSDLDDLLASTEEWDWLVPGLLERKDRMIITGDEGLGKTEFVAQVATCIAAGVHPFLGTAIGAGNEELRVAIVDCENSQSQSRRRYRRITAAVEGVRDALGLPPLRWGKRLFIEFRTEGLNLLKGSDAAWLERFVSNTAPDLLVVGPLYKLHNGDMNNEENARELVAVLDGIRSRHNCAMITEAHAGQAKSADGDRFMRPRGSALFMGWPEFGIGLRRNKADEKNADVVSWRGHREERSWPEGLVRGHSGLLPWRPNSEYWDRPDAQWNGEE